MACRERDQKILRIEFAARAEAATDVVLDHVDRVLGQADLLGENAPIEEQDLGGAENPQQAARRVPFGEQAARLHGEPEVALHLETLAPPIGRCPERRAGVAANGAEREGDVARLLPPPCSNSRLSPLRRGSAVGHRRQGLDIDRDRLERVLADRRAFGEHDRDRLAHIADLVGRDHRLLERLELRQAAAAASG